MHKRTPQQKQAPLNFSSRWTGLRGCSRTVTTATLWHDFSRILLICKDKNDALSIYDELLTFLPDLNHSLKLYPSLDILPFEAVSPQSDLSAARVDVLLNLVCSKRLLVVADIRSVLQKTVPKENLLKGVQTVKRGDEINRDLFVRNLLSGGYNRVSLVEEAGEAAFRGSVADVFSPNYERPLRIEFAGNSVFRMQFFDSSSQRSAESVPEASLIPVSETIALCDIRENPGRLKDALKKIRKRAFNIEASPRETARWIRALETGSIIPGIERLNGICIDDLPSLFDYLGDDALIVLNDPAELMGEAESFVELVKEREHCLVDEGQLVPEAGAVYLSLHDAVSGMSRFKLAAFDSLNLPENRLCGEIVEVKARGNAGLLSRLRTGGRGFTENIKNVVQQWRSRGLRVAFVAGSEGRVRRLKKLLLECDLLAEIDPLPPFQWIGSGERHPLVIFSGFISEGAELPDSGVVFVAESEIFADRSRAESCYRKLSAHKLLSSLANLTEGDYVVHADFGIGIYRGLKHLKVEGQGHDFLHIEYADRSRLYLPVEQIKKVQKYAAVEDAVPKLDRLGSKKWAGTKRKVRESVERLAGDLIKLYAARSSIKGWKFSSRNVEDEDFADGFSYEETPDQAAAIEDCLRDMARERPMDRLICGDAGYGKTEIALRAAFKCVQSAKQTALIAPTTILVEQHKKTFLERFIGYPVEIGAVSRFYKPAQNREILEKTASGHIDIVIGTHKLLQAGVSFKDLGLIIIDEEHRFGVRHKEKLKQLAKKADVLTLTATPIPRTLHMSMVGLRDINVISTPPLDRRAIRTYIAAHDHRVIRDAVMRELQRGGQCFFVHNRVSNIEMITQELEKIVPEARLEFIHGQMKESEIEARMLRFLEKKIDVLVATTIIESGLDIPNANTIIISKAERFGLAQLYQLKGRVGRGKNQAYAYLLISDTRRMSRQARKRLEVLQELDDLGLGFNLAVRDMEIRGTGNLLGKDQSGNVQALGIDLYNAILKEAILNLKGEGASRAEPPDPELKLGIEAYLPEQYIPDVSQRLILYQRLASIESENEGNELRAEIVDRFGRLPDQAACLIDFMRLRFLLKMYGIEKAEFRDHEFRLDFNPASRVGYDRIKRLIDDNPERIRLRGNRSISIKFNFRDITDPADLYDPVKQLLKGLN